MLEILIAGLIGVFLGGGSVWLLTQKEGEPALTDVSPFEGNIVRMTRALIEEWDTHKKKRSGLVERDGDTEFILTIRRPLEKESTSPVYVQEEVSPAEQKPPVAQ